MLKQKAHDLTFDILTALPRSRRQKEYDRIFPIILKELEATYLQGRKDQVDRVQFEQGPSGQLIFQHK